MIKIIKDNNRLLLQYIPGYSDINWIDEALINDEDIHLIKRIFWFEPQDVVNDFDSTEWRDNRIFQLGEKIGEYFKIPKRILNVNNDIFLFESMEISNKTFVSSSTSSIFQQIDRLVEESIYIGGNNRSAIPELDFKKLLQTFPSSTSQKHWANSRISRILKEYLGTTTDAEKKFEDHLKRRGTVKKALSLNVLNEYEVEKYKFIRNRIEEMLKESESYDEKDWQNLMIPFILLLFPKYIVVLKELYVKDFYSNPDKSKNRKIDFALLDANGNIDVIEIKQPFKNCILSTGTYRDNYAPRHELSGTIMQVEKYLFHLNKWGVAGEREINKKRSNEIPDGLKLKITNPKAMIILGRDDDFNESQKFDFEIIKRKYENIMDIITYDDLLLRLTNIIAKFESNAISI